jgi:hypothetical protein
MHMTGGQSPVRTVTDEEVNLFKRNGWVFLPSYVAPTAASEMLRFLEDQLGEDGRGMPAADVAASTTFVEAGFWRDWRFLARDAHIEPFRSICFDGVMGANAHRLMGRHVGVRFDVDGVLIKIPANEESGSSETEWHQDWPNQSHDRVGGMSFWIALNDIPPERGSLQFLSGSHVEGPLGRTLRGGKDLVAQYPRLPLDHALSEPIHYRAGDASVHTGLLVHSAPRNLTSDPRWAYAMTCFPADACYTGAAFSNTDELGLEVGHTFDHPRFPLIHAVDA